MSDEISWPELEPSSAPEDTEAILRDLQRSRIPELTFFDPLVGSVLDYFEGASPLDRVQAVVEDADRQIGSLRQIFRNDRRFEEPDPQLDEIFRDVEGMFSWLAEQLIALNEALESRDEHEAALSLRDSRDALETILICFDMISENHALRPWYSDLPQLNELCRVGYAVIAGRLSPNLLQERLQAYIAMHEAFVAQMEAFQPGLNQAELWEKYSDPFFEALEDCSDGLIETELYFASRNPRQIERGLERLRRATAEILRIQGELSAPPPAVPVQPTAVRQPGAFAATGGLGPQLYGFVEMLRSVLVEETSTAELARELEAQRERGNRVFDQLNQLHEMPAGSTSEQRETCENAREALHDALANVEEALLITSEALESGNLAPLKAAIQLMMLGGESFQTAGVLVHNASGGSLM